jgi:hypothetical protein
MSDGEKTGGLVWAYSQVEDMYSAATESGAACIRECPSLGAPPGQKAWRIDATCLQYDGNDITVEREFRGTLSAAKVEAEQCLLEVRATKAARVASAKSVEAVSFQPPQTAAEWRAEQDAKKAEKESEAERLEQRRAWRAYMAAQLADPAIITEDAAANADDALLEELKRFGAKA